MLDMMNSSPKILILNPRDTLGTFYYKIAQGVFQQNLSRFYEIESAEKVCDQFNNLINT